MPRRRVAELIVGARGRVNDDQTAGFRVFQATRFARAAS